MTIEFTVLWFKYENVVVTHASHDMWDIQWRSLWAQSTHKTWLFTILWSIVKSQSLLCSIHIVTEPKLFVVFSYQFFQSCTSITYIARIIISEEHWLKPQYKSKVFPVVHIKTKNGNRHFESQWALQERLKSINVLDNIDEWLHDGVHSKIVKRNLFSVVTTVDGNHTAKVLILRFMTNSSIERAVTVSETHVANCGELWWETRVTVQRQWLTKKNIFEQMNRDHNNNENVFICPISRSHKQQIRIFKAQKLPRK